MTKRERVGSRNLLRRWSCGWVARRSSGRKRERSEELHPHFMLGLIETLGPTIERNRHWTEVCRWGIQRRLDPYRRVAFLDACEENRNPRDSFLEVHGSRLLCSSEGVSARPKGLSGAPMKKTASCWRALSETNGTGIPGAAGTDRRGAREGFE